MVGYEGPIGLSCQRVVIWYHQATFVKEIQVNGTRRQVGLASHFGNAKCSAE
jgi:hypothetical protein